MRSRREFLVDAFVAAVIAAMPARAAEERKASKTRLILLGTGGGPRPRANSFPSSQVIIVNNSAYVIDCGNGSQFNWRGLVCR